MGERQPVPNGPKKCEIITNSNFLTYMRGIPSPAFDQVRQALDAYHDIYRDSGKDQFAPDDYEKMLIAYHKADDPHTEVRDMANDSSTVNFWDTTGRRIKKPLLRSTLVSMSPKKLAEAYAKLGLSLPDLLDPYNNEDFIGNREYLADLHVRIWLDTIVAKDRELMIYIEEDPALRDLIDHIDMFEAYHSQNTTNLPWSYKDYNRRLKYLLRGDNTAAGKKGVLHKLASYAIDNDLYTGRFNNYPIHEEALQKIYKDLFTRPTKKILEEITQQDNISSHPKQAITLLRRFHALAWALTLFENPRIAATHPCTFSDIALLSDIRTRSDTDLRTYITGVVTDYTNTAPQILPSGVYKLLFSDRHLDYHDSIQDGIKEHGFPISEIDYDHMRRMGKYFYRNMAVAGERCIRSDGMVDWGLLLKDRKKIRRTVTIKIAEISGKRHSRYMREAKKVGIGI